MPTKRATLPSLRGLQRRALAAACARASLRAAPCVLGVLGVKGTAR